MRPDLNGADDADGPVGEVVYTDDAGHLFSPSSDGERVAYRPLSADESWGVEAIGPKDADPDGDVDREVPYVDGSNSLKLIDEADETQALAENVRKNHHGIGT